MQLNPQPFLEKCPCCGFRALATTSDYLMITVQCQRRGCRIKVERGVVNSRTFKKATAMCVKAWNRRVAQPSRTVLNP